jgi:hypothetical protein
LRQLDTVFDAEEKKELVEVAAVLKKKRTVNRPSLPPDRLGPSASLHTCQPQTIASSTYNTAKALA